MARVNPADYLRAKGAPVRLPPAELSTDTLGVVALELAPLRGLGGAQCVAEKVGALTADVGAGHASNVLPELRVWAARWSRVRKDLRDFYEENAVQATRAGNWGIFRILTGQGTAAGPLRGELDQMWIERNGVKASFTLVPTVTLT